MPRKNRTHIAESDAPKSELFVPRHLSKEDFARRLYKLMISKGWHQSELARKSDLPRDSISTYMRGVRLPTPVSLEKLAKAFDVAPADLLPNIVESAIDEDNPSFELKVSPGHPDMVWLRVNRLVSMATAVEITRLLGADNVDANRA